MYIKFFARNHPEVRKSDFWKILPGDFEDTAPQSSITLRHLTYTTWNLRVPMVSPWVVESVRHWNFSICLKNIGFMANLVEGYNPEKFENKLTSMILSLTLCMCNCAWPLAPTSLGVRMALFPSMPPSCANNVQTQPKAGPSRPSILLRFSMLSPRPGNALTIGNEFRSNAPLGSELWLFNEGCCQICLKIGV